MRMAETTTTGRRRNKRGHATREAMLDAALRALAEGGPNAASANRIAKDIGATWGAVKYQFGDIDGLWAAVLRRTADDTDPVERVIVANADQLAIVTACADLLALAYRRTYGIPVTISRCSNNYGPFQYPEKLIPLTIKRALQDRPIPLYGDGKNVRDWLYVEDHCRAIDLILRKGKDGEIYNIGGHREISNRDLIRRILRLLGKPDTLITPVPDRPGHDRRYGMDTKKIRSHLGWQVETDLEEGLKRTVAWYVERYKGP